VPVEPSIDEYFRKKLIPAEGVIPQLAGIDIYGNSIPPGSVGGPFAIDQIVTQAMSISGRVSDMRQIVFANWRQPSGQSWPALAGTAGERSFGHSCSESRLDRISSVLCFA
jgi:hypothetical protein